MDKTVNVPVVVFTNRARQILLDVLRRVAQLPGMDVTWTYKGDELVLTGVEGQEIIFTHPARARTYLDGLLDGYNAGFAAGRVLTDDANYTH